MDDSRRARAILIKDCCLDGECGGWTCGPSIASIHTRINRTSHGGGEVCVTVVEDCRRRRWPYYFCSMVF